MQLESPVRLRYQIVAIGRQLDYLATLRASGADAWGRGKAPWTSWQSTSSLTFNFGPSRRFFGAGSTVIHSRPELQSRTYSSTPGLNPSRASSVLSLRSLHDLVISFVTTLVGRAQASTLTRPRRNATRLQHDSTNHDTVTSSYKVYNRPSNAAVSSIPLPKNPSPRDVIVQQTPLHPPAPQRLGPQSSRALLLVAHHRRVRNSCRHSYRHAAHREPGPPARQDRVRCRARGRWEAVHRTGADARGRRAFGRCREPGRGHRKHNWRGAQRLRDHPGLRCGGGRRYRGGRGQRGRCRREDREGGCHW